MEGNIVGNEYEVRKTTSRYFYTTRDQGQLRRDDWNFSTQRGQLKRGDVVTVLGVDDENVVLMQLSQAEGRKRKDMVGLLFPASQRTLAGFEEKK